MNKHASSICGGVVLALLLPAIAQADSASTRADLLFNWAEASIPSVLTTSQSS
jgi:hypothetical protein